MDKDLNMEEMKFSESTTHLDVDVNQKLPIGRWLLLSLQHVFAMFGATILVPILTGLPISVALFASGIGTLLYSLITRFKVPVYLGSSFAYIVAVQIAIKSMHGNIDAAQTGLILVGLIYIIVAMVIHFIGIKWIDKLLPPVVVGPMIIVIGLGLANNAIKQAGFVSDGNPLAVIIALTTFLIAAFISTKAKGFFKIVPFLVAIIIGFILSVALSEWDFITKTLGFEPILTIKEISHKLASASFFKIPDFYLPFKTDEFNHYNLYFGPETFAMLPVVLVTISEHIGDHTVLGKICGKNFLKDPGLSKTLMGDGVATTVSAFIGGPANTTYGENTGVIGMTKVGSVYVTCGAAMIAILLSFCGYIQAIIGLIPNCVLGGMSILLYGVIASNGLRVLIDNQVDFGKQRNLIIASAMLVIGLGGAVIKVGPIFELSGTALAALVGIILNQILIPAKDE